MQGHHRPRLCIARLTLAAMPLTLVAAAATIAATSSGPAYAQGQPQAQQTQAAASRTYDIPAGPLATVLGRLGADAGILLSYANEQTAGRQSPGVRGNLTPSQALAAALAGTGLEAVPEGSGWRLRAAQASANEAGGATLAEVRVTAKVERGAVTASATRESASTRLQLAPRETPQSVSTITREQIESQLLTTLDTVLRNVTGISVGFYDTQRPRYYSRGFNVSDYQIDGMPSYNGGAIGYDTALYDGVEVVRGVNGIMKGVGEPSATVNLVRKRPQREFAASVGLTAGSWDLYRAEADLNVPLTADGGVRSRFVLAPQKNKSFRDRLSEDNTALLAAIEADVGASSIVSLGYQRQDTARKAPAWGGIPLFATDNTYIDLPRSTNFSPPWTRWNGTTDTLYATLEHQLNDDWSLRASVSHMKTKTFRLGTYGDALPGADSGPFIDRGTGAGVALYAWPSGGTDKQDTLDAYVSGKFELGGRKHDLVVGVSASRLAGRWDGYTMDWDWVYAIPNIFTWDGSAPMPKYAKTGAWSTYIEQQTGLYASARWRVSEPLSVLTGVRMTNWRTHTDNYDTSGAYTDTTDVQRERRKIMPYVGAVYDITPALAVYASHARIFNPQNNLRDRNNQPLSPVIGSNTELGLKADLFDGRMQANFALFQTKQDDLGVPDPDIKIPLPDGSMPHMTVNGTKATGFELDFSGHVTKNWRVNLGLAHTEVKPLVTEQAKHLVHLGTNYQFSGALAPLSAGVSLQWRSLVRYPYGNERPDGVEEPFKLPPLTLIGLHTTWKFSPKVSATLAVNNLTDKKYWGNSYNNYGDPRNMRLTVHAAF